MKLLSSKDVYNKIKKQLKNEISALKKNNIIPSLAVILVGDDPASIVYVNSKKKACQQLGINFIEKNLPAEITQEQLINEIILINQNKSINSFICQVPLQEHHNLNRVIDHIDPNKDVDCFTLDNIWALENQRPLFYPCTIYGTLLLLKYYEYSLKNKQIIVLSKTPILKDLLAALLPYDEYKSLILQVHPDNIFAKQTCRKADILYTAIGRSKFVDDEYTNNNSVIIDIGISKTSDKRRKNGFRVEGDVNKNKINVEALTPVPGGVGPMTVITLMYNVVNACRYQNNLDMFKLVI